MRSYFVATKVGLSYSSWPEIFFLAAQVTSPLGKPEKPSWLHRSIRLGRGSAACGATSHRTGLHPRVTGHRLGDPSAEQGSGRAWLKQVVFLITTDNQPV